MAGLGLTQALEGYRQGVAWRDQQEKVKAQQTSDNAARDAFAGVLDEEKAKWAMQGAEGQYMPNDDTYLRAAQAGQLARAKTGDYEGYMRGAAALAPMVTGMRQKALDMHGDDEAALAKAVYPTFMDNRELQSADWVDGQSPDGQKAAKKLRLTLSDGSVKFMQPGQVKEMVSRSVMTPGARLAEAQMLFGIKRDAARAEEDRATVAARGEVASDLEDQRQAGRLSLADYQSANRLDEIGARGDEARQTKQTIPGKAAGAGGSGGAGGASPESLDLRTTQQIRMRLDSRRKEAGTLLAQQQKAAQGLYGQERKDALAKAQTTYDASMADLNKQDKELVRRLDGGKRPSLADLERPDAAPAGNPGSPIDPKQFWKK